MKKFIAIMVLATLVAMPATAKIFNLGITTGMNVTKPSGESWKTDAKNGWFVGVKAKVSFPVVGLGVDGSIVYSREKVSVGDASGLTSTDKMDYLSIPINLRYDFTLPLVNNLVSPYLAVGPQFSYAFNDLKTAWDNNGSIGEAFDTNKAQWRLNLGLGVILLKHLEVGYRYGLPMGKSFKSNINNFSDLKSGTHQIGLAYYF